MLNGRRCRKQTAVPKDLLLKGRIKQTSRLGLEGSTGAWKLGRSRAVLGR